MNDPKDYRALPGRVAGPLYSARLYQGRDHLLKTTVVGFHEHFRRFAWEDIQAFIVEETPWGGVTNLLLAIVFLMQLVSFVTFTDKTLGVLAIYLPFLIGIGVLMAVNFSRGPTCKTYLKTAVTRERIWSLNRARKARAVIDGLTPLILERQAAAGSAAEASVTTAGSGPDAPLAETSREAPPKPMEKGVWHWLACLFLAIFTVDDALDLLGHTEAGVWKSVILICFAASCAVCAAALISQSRNHAPRSVRLFGLALLGYHLVSTMLMLSTIVAGTAFALRHHAPGQPAFNIRQMSWYHPMATFDLVLTSGVLLFGVATLLSYRKTMNGIAAAAEPLAPASAAG